MATTTTYSLPSLLTAHQAANPEQYPAIMAAPCGCVIDTAVRHLLRGCAVLGELYTRANAAANAAEAAKGAPDADRLREALYDIEDEIQAHANSRRQAVDVQWD